MSMISWDDLGEKIYENGLDHGVLYPPGTSAVAWNGLTSVVEKTTKESSSVYYDGVKINELITPGPYEGTMRAITYPSELSSLEGLGELVQGMYVGDQISKTFGLSYRTLMLNDLDGDSFGYKLHILYNVSATVKDRTLTTASPDALINEFEWDISAIPQEVTGFRPTAHFIVDSREIDQGLLYTIEDLLYGTDTVDPSLPNMADLVDLVLSW